MFYATYKSDIWSQDMSHLITMRVVPNSNFGADRMNVSVVDESGFSTFSLVVLPFPANGIPSTL